MPTDTKPLPATAMESFTQDDIAWMAGLLEGEGYFFYTSAHLGVKLVMTDEDIVSRFAKFWQIPCRVLRERASHHKPSFLAQLPSKKAEQCMRLILPHCGQRRSLKIAKCLEAYITGRAKANAARSNYWHLDEKVEAAWRARPPNISFREFCRTQGLENRKAAFNRLVRLGLVASTEGRAPLEKPTSVAEVGGAWLAGLLEGEGCFQPSRCRVLLEMTDEDVVARFAASQGSVYSPRAPRKAHWSTTYACCVSGAAAVELMTLVLPFMGKRRTARIETCLATHAAEAVRKQDARDAANAHYPASQLSLRWIGRAKGEGLRTVAREYGVHPQVMKNRLLKLGVYDTSMHPRA